MSAVKAGGKAGGGAGREFVTGQDDPWKSPPRNARSIDPAAYGYVPAAQVRSAFAGPSPALETADGLVAAGEWRGMSTFLAAFPATSEWRFAAIARLGDAAAKDDGWLRQWLAAEPKSVDALSVQAESLVALAWAVRTTSQAEKVSREQWDTFFRILRNVPGVCARASELDEADPAPWIALQRGALGLQWKNDKFRELWTQVSARAPHSFTATHRAMNYWRPRWYGSLELMEEFVEGAIAAAPVGSNLTAIRLQTLYDEFRPDDRSPEQKAFDRGERLSRALDAGIADAAASEPDHAKLPHLRHWLAFNLFLAGRNGEAVEQFRALGPHSGAEPWTWYAKPNAKFCEIRALVAARWEDAGRPER
jgi:hypothetical protein